MTGLHIFMWHYKLNFWLKSGDLYWPIIIRNKKNLWLIASTTVRSYLRGLFLLVADMKLSLGLKKLVWSCMLQRGSRGSRNQSVRMLLTSLTSLPNSAAIPVLPSCRVMITWSDLQWHLINPGQLKTCCSSWRCLIITIDNLHALSVIELTQWKSFMDTWKCVLKLS